MYQYLSNLLGTTLADIAAFVGVTSKAMSNYNAGRRRAPHDVDARLFRLLKFINPADVPNEASPETSWWSAFRMKHRSMKII